MRATWFTAAFDAAADYPKQWVVLQMQANGAGQVAAFEVSRWPQQHEAEGHAKKNMARLGR